MTARSIASLFVSSIFISQLWAQKMDQEKLSKTFSDSLIQMASQVEADSLIPYYLEFGHNLVRSYPDSALAIYRFATREAKAQGDFQNEVYGLMSQGYAMGKLKEIDSSRVRYLESIELAHTIQDSSSLFEANESLAKGYFNRSDFENASSYYKEALLFVSLKNTSKVIQLHNRIALCQLVNGQMGDAIEYQTKGLELAKSYDDEYLIGEAYWQLGLINKRNNQVGVSTGLFAKALGALDACNTGKCQNLITGIQLILANAFVELQQLDSAEIYFEKLRKNDSYINSSNSYGFYIHYSKFLEEADRLKEAIAALEKSNQLMEDYLNLEYAIVKNRFRIGLILVQLEEYEKAIGYLEEGRRWFEESNSVIELPESYEKLAIAHYELKNYKSAYDFQQLMVQVQDSLNRIETEKNLQELNTKYEVAEQQNKISTQEVELERQEVEQKVLIGGIAALLLLVGLIYRSQGIKAKANKALAEKNNEIRELERLKTRWFTNIAHELRTPLTLVGGPIEKVLEEENVNVIGKEDLLMAKKNVKQLQETVSEILDISRLEDGQLEMIFKPTDLSLITRRAVSTFDSLAKQKQIELKASISAGVNASIDEGKLNKALINLLMNAFKFTPRGGMIEVSLSVKNEIEIHVMDTGSGISEEDLPYVFDRFFQTKSEEKSRLGGTGVGLSLTKEIVSLHKGHISVESIPNERTTFTMTFPLDLLTEEVVISGEEETPIEEKEDQTQPKIHPSKTPVVLLVEDNADMRKYIHGLLKADYKIIEAENGKEAFELLEKEKVDIIVSDVMMPEMDGISFAKKVKESNNLKSIPFITVTALASEEDKIFTLQIGVDDYLYKPFNPQELKVRVKNLLLNSYHRAEEAEALSFDDELVQKLHKLVTTQMTDNNLNAGSLADAVNMSDRNLRRYLKKVTGLSPIQFIQELRLMKSLELLERKKYKTLNEVSDAVGIQRTSHFSELFERRFGKHPREYFV